VAERQVAGKTRLPHARGDEGTPVWGNLAIVTEVLHWRGSAEWGSCILFFFFLFDTKSTPIWIFLHDADGWVPQQLELRMCRFFHGSRVFENGGADPDFAPGAYEVRGGEVTVTVAVTATV